MNKHYIADESLGGIEREYVEVERKANVGDYVIGLSYAHDLTYGGYYKIVGLTDSKIREDYGRQFLDNTGHKRAFWGKEKYETLKPTDIVRIDGVRYRLVERNAVFGEKIIVSDKTENYDGDYENGDIFEARNVREQTAGILDNVGERDSLYHREYRVLEPVDVEEPIEPITVDETQASPQVIDMLAHIAKELAKINRRLDTAEEHIGDTQRNVETFAARAEETRSQTETNTEAIKALSDNRKFISEIMHAIARYEARGGRR